MHQVSDDQGQLTETAARDRIWPNFKFICILVVVLFTSKNEEDQIKNESARVWTPFSPFSPL